jgi:histidinol-phosphate aminotransferase
MVPTLEELRRFAGEMSKYAVAEAKGCAYRLDKNENLLVPGSLIREVAEEAVSMLDTATYPDNEDERLAEAVAGYTGFDPAGIIFFNGADEAIDYLLDLVRISKGNATRVVVLKPSFFEYSIRAYIRRIQVEEVPLDAKTLRVSLGDLSHATSQSDLTFLCEPNNPTGHLLGEEVVRTASESTSGLVVLDRAYEEFSAATPFKPHGNTVYLGSFSKSYALAGIRLGYIACTPDTAGVLRAMVRPFQVSKFSLLAGLSAVRRRNRFLEVAQEVKKLRSYLFETLSSIEYLEPLPSQANFVLAETKKKAEYVTSRLREKGLCVRPFRGLFRKDDEHIRVTVGPKPVIDILSNELRRIEYSTD